MKADFHVGQGDLAPSLETPLYDENDEALDLTNYDSTAGFRMRLVDKSRPAIETTATVDLTQTPHVVRHYWSPGETDVPGLYLVEAVGTKNGRPETFSNNNKSTLWIAPRV